MTDIESLPGLLDKMKMTQLQSESSRKELRRICNENAQLKDEIKTLCKGLNDSRVTRNSALYDHFQEKSFEWEHFGTKETMLQQMLPETQQALESEKAVLEDIQCMVWQERQDFCDLVLEFSNSYSLLVAPKPTAVQVKAEELTECPELYAAEAEVAKLEAEYEKIELRLIACETQDDIGKQEIRLLKNEASVGNEFVRLQEALKFSEDQCKQIEEECKSFQQMALKDEQLLASVSVSKSRQQSYHFARQATVQPKCPKKPSTYSSFHQLQHASDNEVDQQEDNPAFEEVCDGLRSREAKFSGLSNRKRNSSFWTGGDSAGKSAAEDQQVFTALLSATDTADNSRHPSLEQYKEHSSSRTNSYLNQCKKKSFIPKTPSAISKKLMIKKDRCLLLEKDLSAMFESPTKPSRAEFNKASLSAPLTGTSRVQQGQANPLQHSTTAQHQNSMKLKIERDSYLRTHNLAIPSRPYIT